MSNFKAECQIRKETLPRLNRQHSRGPHRTSSARQCNGRLCRQTHSLNTAEALRTERRHLRRVIEQEQRAEARSEERRKGKKREKVGIEQKEHRVLCGEPDVRE